MIVEMVTASLDPRQNPMVNALLRFAESCSGTGVAVLILGIWPEPKSR